MTKLDMLGKIAELERERDAWKREAQRQADELEALRRKAVRGFTKRELAESQYPG